MSLFRLGVFVLCLLSMTASARAERRVALVVGNGAYQHLLPLANAPLAAKSMAQTLEKAGFQVVEGTDLTGEALGERLRVFGIIAQGADLAIFYYSGQLITVNAIDYILPVDANIKSEMDVKLGSAVSVPQTLDQSVSEAKTRVVIFDTSRDNAFTRPDSGFSIKRSNASDTGTAVMKYPNQSLVGFAAAPGDAALDGPPGGNRPFTEALIAEIASPGVELQQAMTTVRAKVAGDSQGKQLPQMECNFLRPVYLGRPAPAVNPDAK
jgi:uncharacterized caspase-like protein